MRHPDGSLDRLTDYVLGFALAAAKRGRRFALVTLVLVDGSSPRAPGAQMAVDETGDWVGYLSGGCVERVVVAEALEAIRAGCNRRVRYGHGSPYFDVRLPCGSAIELYFDVCCDLAALQAADHGRATRQEAQMEFPEGIDHRGELVTSLTFRPVRRLVILGAGPVAIRLMRLAQVSDFEVELYSNEDETLDYARAAGVRPERLTTPSHMPDIATDSRTAVIFLFHDHDWEERILRDLLAGEAWYIGAIGSKKTHALRVELLAAQGVPAAMIRRIQGPAGLFGGSKNATDIAISILAQIVQMEPKDRPDAKWGISTHAGSATSGIGCRD